MRKTQSKATRIRKFMLKNPKATAKQIADAVGVTATYVYAVQHKQRAKTKATLPKRIEALQEGINKLEAATELADAQHTDNVNHPAHYKVGGIETIDFIEAKQLSYHLGNVVKYITRADHKGNEIEDLHKARWYLNREIEIGRAHV